MWFVILMALTFSSCALYFRTMRQIWDVTDTPTVSPSGAIIGSCEVRGKATTPISPEGKSLPLKLSPASNTQCVWYEILVERYVSDGKNSHWETFRHRTSRGGFRIYDNFGAISVNPEGANKWLDQPYKNATNPAVIANVKNFFVQKPGAEELKVSAEWTTSPDGYYMWHPNLGQWIPTRFVSPDREYFFDWQKNKWIAIDSLGGLGVVFKKILQRGEPNWERSTLRVTETIITPDCDTYIHGHVDITGDGSDITFSNKKGSGYFISTKGEMNVLSSLKTRKWGYFIASFLLSFLLIGIILNYISKFVYEESYTSHAGLYLSIQLAAVFILFLIGAVFLKLLKTYNRFVGLKEQVNLSLSAIDVTSKRRISLIPELVEVVNAYSAHEKSVQEKLALLRNAAPEMFSKELLAIAESYPNLKASENFLQLQNELGRTEEKIAMSRSFYNDSVLAMDNLRATFTGMIFSPFFTKQSYLKL